jgi:hypothetical protein
MNKKYFNYRETKETIRNRVVAITTEKKPPYVYKDHGTYDGFWLGGFRHGYGTMNWPDGARYQGKWKYGKASGYGEFTFPSGEQYRGDW